LSISKKPMIRILREPDLKRLLDIPTAIEIIERTYRNYGTGNSHVLSNPTSLDGGSGRNDAARYKVKGATLLNEQVTGIRLISNFPVKQGFDSCHFLWVYDDQSGVPIGLLNETWLHRFRTALTGVVASKYLARPESKVIALLGAGEIAKQLFPALSDNFELEEIRVVARRYKSAQEFCKKIGNSTSLKTVPYENSDEAIKDADIIITLTLADKPLVRPGMLSPGSFLCSMGETEEVEIGVLRETDKFVVDEFEYATVLGDISQWLRKGLTTRGYLEEKVDGHIGQIVGGLVPGREKATDRIFAIIQGMAICDLALANYALTKAANQGVGEKINLFDRR
jgi:alanine dehydrogenase